MNLKQLVENNAGVFAMTLVITGFLAGVACYESVMRYLDRRVSVSSLPHLRITESSVTPCKHTGNRITLQGHFAG